MSTNLDNNIQLCDFFQKRFLLLLQLLLGTVLIIWVLGKVGGGFFIPGNLRVFLFEFLLCFLKKYLLVLLIDRFTFLAVRSGSKPSRSDLHGFHNAPQPVLL